MIDEDEERSRFFGRRTDKVIISKNFPDDLTGQKLRIMSKVVDGEDGLQFAQVESETVLRVTPTGRYAVKATIFEDSRRIKILSIQRFNTKTGPMKREWFSMVGAEIENFLEFIAAVKTMPLETDGKLHIADDELRKIVLNQAQAERLFTAHQSLFVDIAQREDLKRDLVAVGYRRRQLERFERLLTDAAAFGEECRSLNKSPEGLWQAFFESNTWIFGYGLSYQFLTGLDQRKLEQTVRGYDVTGHGKRADALLKTQGAVKSLCFVEIKRHDTSLLASKPYRSGAWPPSEELSGGVAQVQATVQDAIETIGRSFTPANESGDPTGELLFNVRPRSFLVVGNLDQFNTANGFNQEKIRAFELYRRSVDSPEILTFDELLARARFIVEQSPT